MFKNNEKYSEKDSLTVIQRIRLNFIYGLVVILPIFATVWLILFFVEWVTGPASTLIGPGVPQLVSFIITILFITIIGLLAKNYVGKIILDTAESMVIKVPIIGAIYSSSKQIISAFSLKNKKNLVPVMIEYPKEGLWALGFITQEVVTGLLTVDGTEFGVGKVAVFVPTTPNPTSGYFVYSDKDAIKRLDMTVEQSIKLLMSAGVINP
jgi:uncharacterized membrane protein